MNHVTYLIGIEKDRNGKQIDPQQRAAAMTAIRHHAAHTFGGYTLSHVAGGWMDAEDSLVEEGAIKLEVYTTISGEPLRLFGAYCADMLNQSCVLLDVRPTNDCRMVEGSK